MVSIAVCKMIRDFEFGDLLEASYKLPHGMILKEITILPNVSVDFR